MKIFKWLLFDGRANTDPDRAVILEVCDSLAEARKAVADHRGPGVDFDPVIFKAEQRGSKMVNLQICPKKEQVAR